MSPDSTPTRPVTTARLLAAAVLAQYRVAQERRVILQDHTVPNSMQDAMSLLGRLALEEGREDRYANVLDVLHACTRPLGEWNLEAFQGDFPYANTLLVDPDLLVPTEECEEIAAESGRTHDDVIEKQLHARLTEVLGPLPKAEQHRAYTLIREFIARQSLTSRQHLRGYFDDHLVPDEVTDLLLGHFFIPVPETWMQRGVPQRCAHCGTLTRPHADQGRYPAGRCPLQACREGQEYRALARPFEANAPLVASNQVLRYWVNPAVDELRIYDAAVEKGLPAALYPQSDQCDVSLGRRTGVDVKNYRDAHALVCKLNAGIGGLKHYDVKILAVPDARRDQAGYLQALRRGLKRGPAAAVRVMTVGEVRGELEVLAHA
ncbi:hypothetical protein Dcar01_01775 [Deinococcus carri]|uniref:REase associating with pPIWI RE domain-containing protein n=1 Tax=Deinococcus carri TaxID=1211323 RepID=A0ABP9W6V5_9DEIO